jgi:two-component system LytT family response regulator
MVRANKKSYKINFDELLYLEAQGDYVRFVLSENTLMVHGTMKEFVKLLPESVFQQVHKSYVISLAKIVYLEGNNIKIGEHKIPVSLSFKEQLLNRLER